MLNGKIVFWTLLVIIFPFNKSSGNSAREQVILNIELDKDVIEENSWIEVTLFDELRADIANNTTVDRYLVQGELTKIDLKLTSPLVYGWIRYLPGGLSLDPAKSRVGLTNIGGRFIINEGDSVTIHLHDKYKTPTESVTFSGKDAGKYKLAYIVNNLPVLTARHRDVLESFLKAGKYAEAINLSRTYLNKLCQDCRQMVDQEPAIRETVRNVLLADCYAKFSSSYINRLEMLSNSRYRQFLYNDVLAALQDSYTDLSYANNGTDGTLESFRFATYLLQREMLLQRLRISDKTARYNEAQQAFQFGSVYEEIVRKFKSPIKEKVLLLAFLHLQNSHEDVAGYWDIAESQFTESGYKSQFLALKRANYMEFELGLEDEYGEVWKTEDLAGKYVFIDFWFTGCAGCIALSKFLKPLKEEFLNEREDIVFVNISIDEKRERWLNSLKGGQYGADFELNFWTGGEGRYHPLIKKYGVYAYPTLFLVSPEGFLKSRGLRKPKDFSPQSYALFREMLLDLMD